MNRTGMPWMILVLALLGWQVGGSSGGGGAPSANTASERDGGAAQEGARTRTGAADLQWPELDGLVREYFGPQPVPVTSRNLITLAREAGYRDPDVYIALVADPIDSFLPARFDQVLAGIQEGFAQAGFLLDRIHLPWTAKVAEKNEKDKKDDSESKAKPEEPVFRSRPGILVFRRHGDPKEARLAIVFLVGETAKQGVHKRAFDLALNTAYELTKERPLPSGKVVRRIRILGPTFSGSRESLRLAFAAWQSVHRPTKKRRGEPPADANPLEIWLVSGSATAPALYECAFGCDKAPAGDIRFFRTVMNDEELLRQGQSYLVQQLGWDPGRIALLTEADTAYGRNAATVAEGSRQASLSVHTPQGTNRPADPYSEAFVLEFPSGLSGLRKASEEAARGRNPGSGQPRMGPSTLAISLADQSRPVDVVPEFSILTTPTKDLALSNLLAALCGEGKKSYLGIIASDTRDQVFLAERVHEICPDLQIFLLTSDLMLAHPQNRDALDGAIILSSSALFPRGLTWLEPIAPPGQKLGIRLFQSELHEGIVRAIGSLLSDAEHPALKPLGLEPPRAWVSAIGNGSIWPLAKLPLPPAKTAATSKAASAKANSLTITCMLVLIALSFWLVKVAKPLRQNIPGLPRTLYRRGPFLLALATLQISWGILLVIGGLPYWAFGQDWQAQKVMTETARQGGFLLALVGFATYWVRDKLPKRFPRLPALGSSLRWIAVVCTTVAVAGLLANPILLAWMPGGVELFHFRVRKFTGGMSPIVSLAWIGGGYFLWSIFEIRRRTLVAFQGTSFPIHRRTNEDPILAGCRKIADRIERRMTESTPTWPFWAVIALPTLFSGIYLFQFIQPVAEARAYGWAFGALAVGLFVLALVSFQRFLRLWAELAELLDRIEMLNLAETFKTLVSAVDWRPMKSFAWVIPPFKMTELSIAKLAALAKPGDPKELRSLLAVALEGYRTGNPTMEAEARQALQSHFDTALKKADGWLAPGPFQEFVAVRLIAYLRTVFAHLRSSLLGALVPGFLLLLAISTYEVQPKRVLFLSVWSALAAMVLATIWTFVQMDRNSTLSTIGGTTGGKADLFDRSFVQSVLTYGILPLLGLVATRFPQIERLLSGYLNPLMRFVNGGGG